MKRLSPSHSIDPRVLTSGLRYCRAMGVLRSWRLSRTTGVRRFTVTFASGERTTWTPAQVMAFSLGVRLATQRREAA